MPIFARPKKLHEPMNKSLLSVVVVFGVVVVVVDVVVVVVEFVVFVVVVVVVFVVVVVVVVVSVKNKIVWNGRPNNFMTIFHFFAWY